MMVNPTREAMLMDRRPARRFMGTSGGTFRLHRDQLLYSAHFTVGEDDIRNFDRRPVIACRGCAEVTGTETQRRAEEIRAELLKVQSVGIKAFGAPADQVLHGHL